MISEIIIFLLHSPQYLRLRALRYKSGGKSALHRVIRNNTFNMWEAAGCPTFGERPGEKDIVATLNEPVLNVIQTIHPCR
jgi:hypothetical protein